MAGIRGNNSICVLKSPRRCRRAGTLLESPVSLPRGIRTMSQERGNRRRRTFFAGDDYDAWLDIAAELRTDRGGTGCYLPCGKSLGRVSEWHSDTGIRMSMGAP